MLIMTFHILVIKFVSECGRIHKTVLLQRGAHVIEEVQVFEQPQIIKSLKLSVSKVHTKTEVTIQNHTSSRF